MTRVKNDDFDVVAKKYLKLKSIPYDKEEGVFDGIFRDQKNNLVIAIKKHDNSGEGFGIDCLLDKEGSMEWLDNKLAIEKDRVLVDEIKKSVENNKLRCILIFHKKYTSIYIFSEYNESGSWKYIRSEEYYEKPDVVKINGTSKSQDSIAIEAHSVSIKMRKDETEINYPTKEYMENYLNDMLGKLLFSYLNSKYIDKGEFWLAANECDSLTYDLEYLDSNKEYFLDGLFTCSRFYYIARIIEDTDIDLFGMSCLMFSVAINDELAIKSYRNIYTNGMGIISSSLNLILNNTDDTEKINLIVEKIDSALNRPDSVYNKYQKAFYSCIKCILLRDYSDFNKNVDTLLNLFRHQKDSLFSRGGYIYTCFDAIFLYSLIYFYREKNKKYLPPEPEHFLWDSGLWREIIKNNQERKYNFDIEKVSPVIKKWMDELPEKIDLNELVEELKIKGIKNFPKYEILEVQENEYFENYVNEKKQEFGQKYFTKEYLVDLFKEKIKNTDEYKSNFDRFKLILDQLTQECMEYGSYVWYKNGDAEDLADVFYTVSRLNYLKKICVSGKDDYMTDLVIALSVNDKELIKNIVTKIDQPENCFSVGILALIKHNSDLENQFKDEYKDTIENKNISFYEKAVLGILNGLILRDNKNYTENMNIILDNYIEQDSQYAHSIYKYIPIKALALHTLSYYDRQKFLEHIEPKHKRWNSNLTKEFLYTGFFRKYIIDIKDISPVLKKWMDELPEKIDLNELIESLK